MNNDLGSFGHPLVKSPNIDRLAARGVSFARAYCQFPLCSPSRSSLLTGLRPDTTRVFDLRYHFRQRLPDVMTLPQMFMTNGYYTARVGKMYHYGNPGQIGTSGLDDPASWQEFYNPAGSDKTALELDVIRYTGEKGGRLGAAMAYLNDKQGKDEEHTDGKVATQAIELLQKHKDKPFFLAVGFYRPHCPWITPGGYFEKYSLDTMKLPAIAPGYTNSVPTPALASTKQWPYLGLTPDQARECKLAYYAAISFVDAQIGRVLDALDRLGLRDNTIVVFWSDHGYHLGEHGLWHKQSCFEESARAPLVIASPAAKGAGKTCVHTVELIDLYPTLADLAGLRPPKGLEGASLRPLLENPAAKWTRPAFTQVQRGGFPGHSVRTERWRYTEWDFGAKGAELYDHNADSQELHNLATDPKYATMVAEMKALLKTVHPAPVQGGRARARPCACLPHFQRREVPTGRCCQPASKVNQAANRSARTPRSRAASSRNAAARSSTAETRRFFGVRGHVRALKREDRSLFETHLAPSATQGFFAWDYDDLDGLAGPALILVFRLSLRPFAEGRPFQPRGGQKSCVRMASSRRQSSRP